MIPDDRLARPNCKCHDEPMQKDGFRRGVQHWRCATKNNARMSVYHATPEGRAVQRRYDQSPKGRARDRRYDGSRGGVDRTNRHTDGKRSARVAAGRAEIEAIQKRIRDAN